MSAYSEPIATMPRDVVIQPTRGAVGPMLREAFERREVLWFLTLRDIKAKYVQTKLGWAWAVFQPLGLMLVFTFAFRTLGNVQSDGVAYPLFALAGLAFWTFFQRALVLSADSLAANASLLTKTNSPRILFPLAAIGSFLIDLVVPIVLVLIMMATYGEAPDEQILLLPLAAALGIAFLAGVALCLSAINVQYRDVRNALPFLVQLLMFMSPVAFSLATLGPTAETALAFNPLVGIVESFRWCLLDTPPPSVLDLSVSIAGTGFVIGLGLVYFARVSSRFADVA